MPVCLDHGIRYAEGFECSDCLRERQKVAKAKAKTDITTTFNNKLSEFITLQKNKYKARNRTGYFQCSTCPRKVSITTKGLYGIHWGHWYPKFKYWAYSMNPLNGDFQCHECNVVKEGCPDKMRAHLIHKHGEIAIDNLEAEMDNWLNEVKQGNISESPDIKWLTLFKPK